MASIDDSVLGGQQSISNQGEYAFTEGTREWLDNTVSLYEDQTRLQKGDVSWYEYVTIPLELLTAGQLLGTVKVDEELVRGVLAIPELKKNNWEKAVGEVGHGYAAFALGDLYTAYDLAAGMVDFAWMGAKDFVGSFGDLADGNILSFSEHLRAGATRLILTAEGALKAAKGIAKASPSMCEGAGTLADRISEAARTVVVEAKLRRYAIEADSHIKAGTQPEGGWFETKPDALAFAEIEAKMTDTFYGEDLLIAAQKFGYMMEKAVKNGVPLTRELVNAVKQIGNFRHSGGSFWTVCKYLEHVWKNGDEKFREAWAVDSLYERVD